SSDLVWELAFERLITARLLRLVSAENQTKRWHCDFQTAWLLLDIVPGEGDLQFWQPTGPVHPQHEPLGLEQTQQTLVCLSLLVERAMKFIRSEERRVGK